MRWLSEWNRVPIAVRVRCAQSGFGERAHRRDVTGYERLTAPHARGSKGRKSGRWRRSVARGYPAGDVAPRGDFQPTSASMCGCRAFAVVTPWSVIPAASMKGELSINSVCQCVVLAPTDANMGTTIDDPINSPAMRLRACQNPIQDLFMADIVAVCARIVGALARLPQFKVDAPPRSRRLERLVAARAPLPMRSARLK